MSGEARAIIGKVLSAHGVRGQVKIRPLTDYPERYLDMDNLSLYRDGQLIGAYPIEQVRSTPNDYFLVALEGVTDMDQAEALRGCTVEILKSERTQLPEGEYWISDLIGLDAKSDEGIRLGKVRDIVSSGASQLIVITDDEGKEHMVPANGEFLLDADLNAGHITIRLIDGLWDL